MMLKKKMVLWFGVTLFCSALFSHFWIKGKNTKFTFSYLKKFAFISYTNSYALAAPKFNCGNRVKKAVLLLHGFSGSPNDFQKLTERLSQAGIPFYVPLITGFGIGNFQLLEVVQLSDWLRDAIFGFDLLFSFAEQVDVIGHSNGGSLAVLVAAHRPVNQLILSGPDLATPKKDQLKRWLAETPFVSEAIMFLYPVAKKPQRPGRIINTDTLDPIASMNSLHYRAVPSNSIKVLWDLQKEANCNLLNLSFKQLFLLYGKQDLSVDNVLISHLFEKNKIPYRSIVYPRSGHNIFEDYDREQAIEDVINIIQNNI
jgi:esterase/lipase